MNSNDYNVIKSVMKFNCLFMNPILLTVKEQ